MFPFPFGLGYTRPGAVTQGTATSESSTTDLATYTFTTVGASIAYDEYPLIAIHGRSGGAMDFSSVTLGGVSCTQLYNVANGFSRVAWYSAPRGTSGNLVINWNATAVRCLAGIIPLKNLVSYTATTGTGTSTADPMNASIDCKAGGWIGGVAYSSGGATDTQTWTNLTEKLDLNIESAGSFGVAGGVFGTAETARSITSNPLNPAVSPIMALIALR